MEAVYGLIGVIIGAAISWFQVFWTNKQAEKKSARYLAIRIACILDKYLEDCTEVVKDDGLSFGQRTSDGCLSPQVKAPGVPVFPDDVDWKSIDHELMYKILSFPSEVEGGERLIKASETISVPPDYEDWFIERKFHYSQFGLIAYHLSGDLCEKYSIKKKTYNDWNPAEDLKNEFEKVSKLRDIKLNQANDFVKKHLG